MPGISSVFFLSRLYRVKPGTFAGEQMIANDCNIPGSGKGSPPCLVSLPLDGKCGGGISPGANPGGGPP